MRWASIAILGIGAMAVAFIMANDYHSVMEMKDLSIQAYLRLYGESIYEHHALTGKWPSEIDDLSRTSLPLKDRSGCWKSQLETQADVIMWPKDLKPDPRDNGHVILCYHSKGLDAERGQMWVCWGNLRTECITLEELQDKLNKLKN
jgi:hypothetical protein